MSDDHHSPVEYRDVPGFPGYRVGNDGSIWSCIKPGPHRADRFGEVWRILKCKKHPFGYVVASLYVERKAHQVGVHIIVLTAFVGPCPPGMEGCHRDRNPANNRLANLRWDTRTNNHADMVEHDTHVRGERCGHAKLTEDKVREIRSAFATSARGGSRNKIATALASKYGVSARLIEKVVERKAWKHVA